MCEEWNLETSISTENGGISDIYFEDSNDPEDDFYIDSTELAEKVYPELYEHIETEIFRRISDWT